MFRVVCAYCCPHGVLCCTLVRETQPRLTLRMAGAGNKQGLPKHVVVNLGHLTKNFSESEVVSKETVMAKKLIKVNKRDAKLPLKVSCGPATLRCCSPALPMWAALTQCLHCARCLRLMLSWLQVLGRGQLTKPLKFEATAFSEVATASIKKAGGNIEMVGLRAMTARLHQTLHCQRPPSALPGSSTTCAGRLLCLTRCMPLTVYTPQHRALASAS